MRGDRPDLIYTLDGANRFTPACAGIDRLVTLCSSSIRSLPRMRGDRPHVEPGNVLLPWFTPHARGSTLLLLLSWAHLWVYPACAGIDLVVLEPVYEIIGLPRMRGIDPKEIPIPANQCCLPRMRGDRPESIPKIRSPVSFTPHARGSTLGRRRQMQPSLVYPACAGIDPHCSNVCMPTSVYPACAGSTSPEVFPWMSSLVYPACAGIDPSRHQVGRKCERLPRMRGDRPKHAAPWWRAPGFTPHARGSTTQ